MPKQEEQQPSEGEEQVLTPGGKRPKSAVRHVRPGETVSGEEVGQATGEEPAGMNPGSAAQAAMAAGDGAGSRSDEPSSMRPQLPDGSAQVAPTDASGEEPRGMRPASGERARAVETGAAQPDVGALVLTPGGFRDRSLVHAVEPEHVLDLGGESIRMLHVSGHEVADFGPVPHRPGEQPLMPGNVGRHPSVVPALGSGWIAYAYWTNNTGHPVRRFATTWVVPPVPATDHGQTIFLFNGIQNSTMIYQPVLQWGPSAAGGGSYWAVASWYVDGQGGVAFHSNLVPVNPDDVLVGVMSQTGQTGSQFSYGCEFIGIANTGLPISNVQELTWNIETLEAYGIQQCSDYPNANFTAFTGIDFETGVGRPAIGWTPVNAITDCGQSARVVSNANAGGEVDIYYTTRVSVQAASAADNSDGRLETFLSPRTALSGTSGRRHRMRVRGAGSTNWAGSSASRSMWL